MRFKTLSGKFVSKNCNKYKINWDKEEKSKIQTEVKKFLYPYLKTHIVYSEFPVFGTLMKIDIFDATSNVAYEIQGRQHGEYVKFFHKNRLNYLAGIKRDMKKIKWCEINNITLCEIFEEDLQDLSRQWFIEKFNVYL